MDIEFDPTKDAANIAKHGVSLADAASLEWDTALTVDDDRQNYGEQRQTACFALYTRFAVTTCE